MSDRILAVLAILGVTAYFLPLILNVPEPALIVVLCVVIAMMAYDFWRELWRQEHPDDTPDAR